MAKKAPGAKRAKKVIENADKSPVGRYIYTGPRDDIDAMRRFIEIMCDSGAVGTCPVCSGAVHRKRTMLGIRHILTLRFVHQLGRQATPADIRASANGKTSNDYSDLARWGLMLRDKKTKNWFVTEHGRRFLYGQIAVPAFVITQHRHVIETSAVQTTVFEVMKKKTRYNHAETIAPWNPAALRGYSEAATA